MSSRGTVGAVAIQNMRNIQYNGEFEYIFWIASAKKRPRNDDFGKWAKFRLR